MSGSQTDSESDKDNVGLISGSPSVELSANRTSLSFERTMMSADRTLMSILRTALSLITFGFTIFETFQQLSRKGLLDDGDKTARALGAALLCLGILMLSMGIWSHAKFGRELTARRARLYGMALLHHAIRYRATPTFAVAMLLLVISLCALASIIFRLLAQ